ncbi:hypothetical protein R1flu_018308 [Riccia fluitans]|uniref:Methylmalonyl-CoA epimerase, mitochondrial n=1 Tax=Riccia fluitans TaxID=41844 RepID=A0ABD1ZGR8_9MARC
MDKLMRNLSPRLLQQSKYFKPTNGMDFFRAFSSQSVGIGRGSGGRASEPTVRSGPENIPYNVKGLAHIAVAVPDLSQAAETYRTAFGAQVSEPKPMPDQGATVVFVHLPNVNIELLHPLGDTSPISKFLQKNPKGGIHHVCLNVDNVHAAAEYLIEEAGVKTLGSGLPTIGAEGKPILFLNPKDTAGVLIELQQANASVHSTLEK